MGKFIPLSIPNFEGNEEKYVMDAVKQGWVSTGGAYITRLEEQLAQYLQVPATAACQSGTAALHLALHESGIGPGDAVIVPALTFIAAVNPVRYQFAEPVFMDCDKSLCMDPVKLRHYCEEECTYTDGKLVCKANNKQIKAIVVVHVFGNLADMEGIMEVAETYHLRVIEDATEALGSKFLTGKYAGKMAGTIGDFGAYSFNGNKIITTGGGGALVASDPNELQHMKYLSTQAKDDALFYVHDEAGFNYRMTNLQAALGVAQLEELPEFINRKRKNFKLYQEKLESFSKAHLMPYRENTESNCWFYALIIGGEKDQPDLHTIIERFQDEGIQTRPVWGLIHEQKPYQKCIAYQIDKAKDYSNRIINLPCSTNLTEEELDYVVEKICEIII